MFISSFLETNLISARKSSSTTSTFAVFTHTSKQTLFLDFVCSRFNVSWRGGGKFGRRQKNYCTVQNQCVAVLHLVILRFLVKGYTRFVEQYVTGRMQRFRLYKVIYFLDQDKEPSRSSHVRPSYCLTVRLSVCPYELRDLRYYKS